MKIHMQSYNIRLLSCLLILTVFSPVYSVDQQPQNSSIQVIDRPPPKYPILALMKRIEGWVKVQFTISAEGDVFDPVVVDSSPRKIFDKATIEAVKQFKFKPKIVDGKPVAIVATQTIEFEIPKQIKDQSEHAIPLEIPSLFESKEDVSYSLPEDLVMLIKSIDAKSKIKTHKRSLKELEAKIIPDGSGRPYEIKVTKNTYGKALNSKKIKTLLDGALFRAQVTYTMFHGYFNPVFSMKLSKNQPARIFPTFSAKSMPLPELSLEFQLKARITISDKGIPIKAENATFGGAPVDKELVIRMLNNFHFFEGHKKFKSVEDILDLTITYIAVQKDDIQAIKDSMGYGEAH